MLSRLRRWLFPCILCLLACPAGATINVLAYWRLGEYDPGAAPGILATNTRDSVGNHDLTCTNQCLYSSDVSGAAAAAGSSLSLNFAGPGACAHGNLVTSAVDNFGIEAWVKTVSTNNQIIAYNGNTSVNGWGLMVFDSNWTVLFGGHYFFQVIPATTNVWTHLALVSSGGISTLYVNGTDAGQNVTFAGVPSGAFALGVDPQNLTNEFFHGKLDEVRVFNFTAGQFSTNDLLYFAGSPVAVTEAATSVSATGATFNGTVNPKGLPTSVSFQWGTTTNYGKVTIGILFSGSPGTNSYSQPLSGLSPATTYHYRLVASNQAGTTYGADSTFTTWLLFDLLPPAGARLAESSASAAITAPGQAVTYSVFLAAGQILSATIEPTGDLIPAIEITDPNGSPFAFSSAASTNQNLVLESVPILLDGTYQISISGINGTTGTCSLAAVLNAGIEQERYLDQPNNSPATAEDLEAYAISVGSGQQMAVIGDFAGRPSQPWPDPADLYRLFLFQGQTASFVIANQTPGSSQIKLEDGNGNVLALGAGGFQNASQAIMNFTAAYSGYYYVAATGDSGLIYSLVASVNSLFDLKPDIAPGPDLAGLTTAYGAVVSQTNGLDSNWFSVPANVSDALHFATANPSSGPPELANGLYPELLLYDPNFNLVAIANGNASDGRNSVIDFTVPGGDSGTWFIQITPSPSTPNPTIGDYVLTVTGSTANQPPGLSLIGSTPSTAQLVAPPTTVTIDFSEAIYGPSLTPGELQINNVPCVSVVLSGASSATWTPAPGTFSTGAGIAENVVFLTTDASGHRVASLNGVASLVGSFSFQTSINLTPPTAGPDLVTAVQNTPTNFSAALLLSNDSSPIGGRLHILSVTNTTGAAVSLTNSSNSVAYTPPPGFAGLDEFNYVLSDGRFTATGAVSVVVTPIGAPPYNRLALSGPPANPAFKYSGFPGQQYVFQSAPALFGPWTDLYPMPFAGLDGFIQFTYPMPLPPPIQFYRVRTFP